MIFRHQNQAKKPDGVWSFSNSIYFEKDQEKVLQHCVSHSTILKATSICLKMARITNGRKWRINIKEKEIYAEKSISKEIWRECWYAKNKRNMVFIEEKKKNERFKIIIKNGCKEPCQLWKRRENIGKYERTRQCNKWRGSLKGKEIKFQR